MRHGESLFAPQLELLGESDEPRRKKKAVDLFAEQMRSRRFLGWIREHAFGIKEFERAWRFDFAHLELKLAIEIEGLRVEKFGKRVVCTGRHTTVDGYAEDCRKYASAVILGWQVLRFVQKQVTNDEAINYVEEWYGARTLARNGLPA